VALQAQHAWHRWPADVHIQQAHLQIVRSPFPPLTLRRCSMRFTNMMHRYAYAAERSVTPPQRSQSVMASNISGWQGNDTWWPPLVRTQIKLTLASQHVSVFNMSVYSNNSTWPPAAASAKASCAEKVDLPTPPLPDSTRIVWRMRAMRAWMAATSAEPQNA
jgi:hypothetical protein